MGSQKNPCHHFEYGFEHDKAAWRGNYSYGDTPFRGGSFVKRATGSGSAGMEAQLISTEKAEIAQYRKADASAAVFG
jgi:hypothetical protein